MLIYHFVNGEVKIHLRRDMQACRVNTFRLYHILLFSLRSGIFSLNKFHCLIYYTTLHPDSAHSRPGPKLKGTDDQEDRTRSTYHC